MDIGLCIASHILDEDYVVQAEALGYSHAWFADSQMLWSDCYASLALAAKNTSTIRLGTGVAVSGTRPPPVTASSIATINALAPGRTFLGIGSGNTAMRVMGLPPQPVKAFDRYLATLKPLLQGQESSYTTRAGERLIRHIMPDHGFVSFDHDIPLYVSGFGPKSLAVAGRHGEGAVLGLPASASMMENVWAMLEAENSALQRNQFYTTALTAIGILEPGEAPNSPRMIDRCGAMAMASMHYAFDQFRNFGHQPPHAFAEVWEDYTLLLNQIPEERLHQRIHMGHNCWVVPEELAFLTPEVMTRTCLIGEQDDVLERLFDLRGAGLNQVMNLPNFDTRYEVLREISDQVIEPMQGWT